MQEVLSAIQSRPAVPEMTLGDVLQLKLGRLGDRRLPVTDLRASGWVDALLSKLAGQETVADVEPPATFQGTLRPYQIHGLAWLLFLGEFRLGACLADDMGLGKTIQVLALLLHLQEEGTLEKPFLLICPTSVVGNWRKEAERFAPTLSVLIHHGLDRHEGEEFKREAKRHHLVVSTYSLAHRDLEQLDAVEWGGLVLDEAQNIKNPQAKQTKALRRLNAPRRIALTGTPVENRLQELWSIMEFLNPGYLGIRSGIPPPLRPAHRALSRRGGHGRVPPSRRAVRSQATEDRPDRHQRPAVEERDEGLLHAHPGAGDVVPGTRAR